jgi:hypothetical protein
MNQPQLTVLKMSKKEYQIMKRLLTIQMMIQNVPRVDRN